MDVSFEYTEKSLKKVSIHVSLHSATYLELAYSFFNFANSSSDTGGIGMSENSSWDKVLKV